ncbi:alpha/beta fold hydrolase [Azospirillum humicireducens]|uniref:alpha/beta fold hydrolase n=1 Tax=Azospirillum humicireducens TaxID=1226968 RepID=UPI0007C0F00C|nr:alpha/beta hydrolase [Azospirillum humicireducens]
MGGLAVANSAAARAAERRYPPDGRFVTVDGVRLHRYADVTVPVAIFAGHHDRVVEQEEQSGLPHHVLSDSTLHWVPDCGHMVHYADPEPVVRRIDEMSTEGAPLRVAAQR